MKEGSKYHALFKYLNDLDQAEVGLTFAQIEAMLGSDLPPSARTRRGWWSNRSRGALQASAWMAAGYHVLALDLAHERVTFARPLLEYTVKRVGDSVVWDGDLIKALRYHLGFTQEQLAQELGVRQQTISEWETGAYAPSRATSKHLTLVAERVGFPYVIDTHHETG